MKKRFLPTLGAFIVLALLLVYANYFEIEEKLPPGVQKPVPILGCSDQDIVSLTWKNGAEAELKVKYSKEGSRISSPADYPADQGEAEGLLKHFSELKSELIIAENATDTASYGITASSPVVLVETATQTVQLALGAKTEVGGSYYLVRQGDPRVFMVPGYIKGSFAKSLADLRDKRLFSEDFGQVSRIAVEDAEGRVELRQNESLSGWEIVAPASYSADGVAVAQLLENLRNLKVSRFVEDKPEDAAGYGFAPYRAKILVANRDNREFAIETGEMSGVDTYVRVSGSEPVHAVLTSELHGVLVDLNGLREKHLDIPALESLKEIKVADASGSITLERKESGWMVGAQKIADSDVKDFVNSLGRTRVNSFAEPENLEEYGLKDAEKARSIELVSDSEKLKILVGARKGASLSLLVHDELIDINAEADDAFGEFMHRLRRPPEEVKNVVIDSPTAASTSVAPEETP